MNVKISLAVIVAVFYASAIALLSSTTSIPAYSAEELAAEITQGSSNKTLDAFSPNPINAHVGDIVNWTNRDSTPHTVTSGVNGRPDGTFDSSPNLNPLMASAATFSHTFTEAGGYPYYCALHPNMIGTVIVASIGGSNQTTGGQFTIAGTDEKGNEHEVTGTSQNATATSFTINSGESVEIQFNGTGKVELSLPKTLIANITAVQSGNDTIQHEVINENATSTTISFEIPEGQAPVKIMGGFVVPEFSVIIAILGGAIIAVIGFNRFAINRMGFFGRT
jgi:plastocyanin